MAKCSPANITESKKCKHEKQILSTMIVTEDLSLET